ncbi:MAG: hypothetical protein ACK55I_41970, partial [bacterium]
MKRSGAEKASRASPLVMMMKASWILGLLLACFWMPANAAWLAGAARADITPVESVPLAGYGGKTRMSQRVDHPIWLKS